MKFLTKYREISHFTRFCLIASLLILAKTAAWAGNPEEKKANLTGIVMTSDGQPAPGVSVYIQELKKGTLTSTNGEFSFNNIPPGDYHLEVSMLGFEKVTHAVSVGPDGAAHVKIELQENSMTLDEVTVVGGGNRFARKESDDISKMPLGNMENPQVYTVVSKELMKEQVVTDYNSAFKNVPGAGISEVRNQGRSSNISRGFSTPQLVRNGVGRFTYATVDPAHLERIEVIKGPSATLFGSTLSSYGRHFNRVTKKHFDT